MDLMKVALYARVSTDDKGQDPEVQLRELRAWAEFKGHEADEYVDRASAGDLAGRTAWRELIGKCLRPRPAYQAIAIQAWDRGFRSLTSGLVALDQLREHGVEIVELRHGFDTTTATGKLLAALMLGLAEMELETMRARIRSGMAAAKASGKHVGRPRVRLSPERAARMVRQHGSIAAAAAALDVSPATVKNRLRQFERRTNSPWAAKNQPPNWPERPTGDAR